MEAQPVTSLMSSKDMVLRKAKDEATLRRSWTFGNDPGSAILMNEQINKRILAKDRGLRETGSTKMFAADVLAVIFMYSLRLATGQRGCPEPSCSCRYGIKIGFLLAKGFSFFARKLGLGKSETPS